MKSLSRPQSGSIAGQTHTRARGSQTVRSRRSPVQRVPNFFAAPNRGFFGQLSSQFSQLSSARQLAWRVAADSHPHTDPLGQPVSAGAKGLFIALNMAPLIFGNPVFLDPPRSWVVFNAVVNSFVADNVAGLQVDLGGGGGPSDAQLISVSTPGSSGSVRPRVFSIVDQLAGNSTGIDDITGAFVLLYGAPAAGQRIWVRVLPINQFGARGVPRTQMAIVT